jgi:uncharacterized membrane protein YjjP (DUF1212 family)
MTVRELIDVGLKAGEILLCSGAEIYRVEDTVTRIFRAYGSECECFVLLTGIFISSRDEIGETVTIIKRIKGHSFDLRRIELVNDFSRSLQGRRLEYAEALAALGEIEGTRKYGFVVRIAAAGITAFVYALLFKGGVAEGIIALFISMFIYLIKDRISRLGLVPFFEFFVSGLIAGSLSIVAVEFVPDVNIYKIIIGAVMILVPGVALTNGIKDALYGDTVSSLYRLAEAAFISIAVGSGVGIILSIGLRWI